MKTNKNYRFEKIEAVRDDGKIVRGRLYLPLDENAKFRTAIFAHGFGGCYRDLMHYGPMFAEAGLALCLFDFCGGGPLSSSDGTMAEMSVLTEYDDYLAVLRKVKEHPQVDENSVFLMGESQGGYVAVMVGSDHPDESAGLVLWYPSVWMLPKAIEYAGLAQNYPGIMDLYAGWLAESDNDECVTKWDGLSDISDAEDKRKEPVRLHAEAGGSEDFCAVQQVGEISDTVNIWGLDLNRKYIDDMIKVDMESLISSYPKRVLILQGDSDEIVPLKITYKTVKTFPHASLHVIKGGGHGFEGDGSIEAGNTSISYIRNFSADGSK